MRRWLTAAHEGDANTIIVEEMGIWAGTVRIDVAVINGELHGVELKSARDTLVRLPEQQKLFSEVFDRVTLVVARNHILKALPKIPEWWGVVEAQTTSSGNVELVKYRTAALNPAIVPVQIARLLWRDEAIDVLTRYGLERGFRSKPAEVLFQRLASSLTIDQLRDEVRETLKRRRRGTL